MGEFPSLLKDERSIIPYTDDTAMALALLESISEGHFNPQRTAETYYRYYKEGKIRMIGATTYKAFKNFEKFGNWFYSGVADERAAGNGTAMRVAPLSIFAHLKGLHLYDFYEYVRKDSYITHRNEEAISGAFAVAYILYEALKSKGVDKKVLVENTIRQLKAFGIKNAITQNLERALELFNNGSNYEEAKNYLGNSGYIVHSVGFAVFIFLNEENLIDGILKAVEYTLDSDTIGAIFGAMFGAYYGSYPKELVRRLEVKGEIDRLLDKLLQSVK